MQRALIQYRNPNNYELVKEALLKGGREDLIGFDKKCLIRPRKMKYESEKAGEKKTTGKNGERRHRKTDIPKNGHSKQADKPRKKTIRNVHKKKK